MKIAIDVTRAIIEQAGVGRYVGELTLNMVKSDPQNEYLIISTHFYDSPEKAKALQKYRYPHVKIKHIRIPGEWKERIWGWKHSGFKSFLQSADILFAPSLFEVNMSLKIPQVVSIHDLSTVIFPEQRGLTISQKHNRRLKQVCQKAAKIITISQSTKNDLIKGLDLSASKIKVIYPGKTEFKNFGILPKEIEPKSYILAVGTIEPRKNLISLFRAYVRLPLNLQNQYPLVIAGGKGWNDSAIFKTVHELGIERKINFLGFVSDEVLGKLYKEAAVFVYPSLYEGFGLPIIEAMQFGTPVITADTSSMPEAAGNAALIIKPKNINAIAKAIENILIDKKLRHQLSQKGLVQAKKFSWEKSARETIELLEEVSRG